MPDIHIVQKAEFPADAVTLDWLLTPAGALSEDDALATAVIVALGTDALARPDDVLPDPDDSDRRGWWADFEAQQVWDGWPIGSRLWLLRRAKITGRAAAQGATLAVAEEYVREALRPFLTRRVASRMDVRASRSGIDRIDVRVVLYRGALPAIELRYADLWGQVI